MKKHKTAEALACVVFLTAAWAAVAAGQEERPLPGPEWKAPDDYFPEWFEPGEVNSIPGVFSANDPYSLRQPGERTMRVGRTCIGAVLNQNGLPSVGQRTTNHVKLRYRQHVGRAESCERSVPD